MRTLLAITCLALLSRAVEAQEIYTWEDDKGVLHYYSDHPAHPAASVFQKDRVPYSQTNALTTAAPAEPHSATRAEMGASETRPSPSPTPGLVGTEAWLDETGQPVSHAPDYFARRVDGSAVVVDCRPEERRGARDAAKFEATAQACARVGWEYRLVGAADEMVTANVRWLAGYRHPRHHQPGVASVLRRVFAAPAPLMAGAEAAGDPVAVLPVLFHLLWRHELTADLSVPLGPGTLLSPGPVTV